MLIEDIIISIVFILLVIFWLTYIDVTDKWDELDDKLKKNWRKDD